MHIQLHDMNSHGEGTNEKAKAVMCHIEPIGHVAQCLEMA